MRAMSRALSMPGSYWAVINPDPVHPQGWWTPVADLKEEISVIFTEGGAEGKEALMISWR